MQAVALIGAEPTFTMGLASAFANHAFEVVEPADPVAWSSRPEARGMVLHTPSLAQMDLLAKVSRVRPHLGTVTILLDVTEATASEALRRGANGIVHRNAEPRSIVSAVLASLRGETVLPTEVARRMIGVPTDGPTNLDRRDMALLESLVLGVTTENIAAQMCCSVRTLNRWKQALYQRIGAKNQSEAIALAIVWGLADDACGTRSGHLNAKGGIELTGVGQESSQSTDHHAWRSPGNTNPAGFR